MSLPDPPTSRPAAVGTTKDRLLDAAQQTVRHVGLAGVSARTIAARARANQALIFYHFHTVSELIEAASNAAVDEAVARYRESLADVTTLGELLHVGRNMHEREQAIGNVTFMAQILSGAQHDPVLARAAGYAISAWTREIRTVLDRVMKDNPAADLIDTDGFAHLISAGFIGVELYEGADRAGAAKAIAALDTLGGIATMLDTLGPIARRALTTAAQRRTQTRSANM